MLKTHISIVLDRSGSMAATLEETIKGFNELIKEQAQVEGECFVSLNQFDNEFESVFEDIPVKLVQERNTQNFVPRGATALYDAIGKTLAQVKYKQGFDKKLLVIISDGMENSSAEFDADMIKNLIEDSKGEVDVLFIGADEQQVLTAKKMGTVSMCYAATSSGTATMYNKLSRAIRSYRTEGDLNV